MRVLPLLLAALCALLALSTAAADLAQGESKRYAGPLNGLDPCLLPDTGEDAVGGACFPVTLTGKRVRIAVDDEVGVPLAMYRVLDAQGEVLMANDFCGEIVTPPLHPRSATLSVSVYPGWRVDNCAGSAGTGLRGVITVKALME